MHSAIPSVLVIFIYLDYSNKEPQKRYLDIGLDFIDYIQAKSRDSADDISWSPAFDSINQIRSGYF